LTQAQFEALVKKLEKFAQKSPRQYRLYVGLIAILGYGYILSVFIIAFVLLYMLMGLFVAAISNPKYITAGSIKGFVVMVAILSIIIAAIFKSTWRALTLKFDPPEGLRLDRRQVPELFVLLDQLGQELKINNLEEVVLVPEFNASVVQIPRFGAFGLIRNYLIIGLPLLQCLSPEQFTAVIAHEFGHLSENHSKFGAWIYRLSIAYSVLLQRIGQEDNIDIIFKAFLNWYTPFLNAYSFILRRQNEYMADSLSARISCVSNMAHSLILTDIYGVSLGEQFWPNVYKQVDVESEPPNDIFDRLNKFLYQ
jgi:Zn-dependent protease with chaperone function